MKPLWILVFSFPLFAPAQNKPLMIEGASPNFYITHLVAPKENYYSIGRMYNVSPKEVAPFNNSTLDKGLNLGQTLKIPLSPANFAQAAAAGTDEALVPLYHSVEGKEGLYRVSVNYNKLPVETIKQWNNLKGDAVEDGMNLIVGYLKVKKELSPLAAMAKPVPVKEPATIAKTPATKETAKTDLPKESLPPAKDPAREKPVVPVADKVKKEAAPDMVVKKEPAPEEVKEALPEKKMTPAPGKKNFNGGVFRSDYDKQVQNKDIIGATGKAAVFKSTSGWEDGKYYCLHNDSSPGTIVKITNSSTGKSVYAKVLDVIPDIEQNTGLLVRISNAAADELGAGGEKFDCTLSYSK